MWLRFPLPNLGTGIDLELHSVSDLCRGHHPRVFVDIRPPDNVSVSRVGSTIDMPLEVRASNKIRNAESARDDSSIAFYVSVAEQPYLSGHQTVGPLS